MCYNYSLSLFIEFIIIFHRYTYIVYGLPIVLYSYASRIFSHFPFKMCITIIYTDNYTQIITSIYRWNNFYLQGKAWVFNFNSVWFKT